MMRTVRSLLLALGLSLTVVAACSGGATGGETTAAVKNLVQVVESKQFERLPDLACSAQREALARQFDFATSLAGELPGIDEKKLRNGLTIKFNDLDVREVSRSGDKAEVSLKAKVQVSLDATVLKELARELLKSQGIEATDAQISAAVAQFSQLLNQTQDLDERVQMVNEGGKWLVCEPASS